MKYFLNVHNLFISMTLIFMLHGGTVHANADPIDDGYLNPVEDLRYYMEQLERLPERLGVICWAAYEVHKEGKHESAMTLLNACADRGLVASMLMLSNFYENGILNTGEIPEVSTLWLKRAADTGDSRGQYYYGLALLRGYGHSRNQTLGRQWIELAARQGFPDAVEAYEQWR
ncbi:sel1 repeat family protein [Amphritea atlantica]|uniref:Sel1 repeat family protein n=1 Tax=Amphritea atlantica TaxID=355243 RepID=A0ABY5GXT1_9GAMM|nr:sel1 repeat family protein [Amphritea atlantica]